MKYRILIISALIGALVGAAAWASIKHFAYIDIGWIMCLIAVLAGLGVWVVAPTGIPGNKAVNLDPAARAEVKARRRRCRLRRAATALGIVVAIIGGLALRLRLGMLPHVDYAAKLAELYEQQLPPSARGPGVPNEWPRLQRVLDRVVEVDHSLGGTFGLEDGERFVDFRLLAFEAPPKALATHRFRASVGIEALEQAGVFGALREAVAHPKLLRPINPTGDEARRVHSDLLVTRHIMSALDFRMHQAMTRGDAAVAAESLELLIACMRKLELQPFLFEQLSATGFRLVIARQIARHGSAESLDPDLLQALLELVQLIARRETAEFLMECRHLEYSRDLQRAFAEGVDRRGIPRWIQPALFALLRSHAHQQRFLDERCSQAKAMMHVPFAQQRGISKEIWNHIEDMDFFDFPLTQVIGPLEIYGYQGTRGDCEVAGAILILAIELHRARHGGRPPDSLDALIPGELAELPRDPFAPDGCFIYRSLSDVPGTVGPPYVLYSVGSDQCDNGGLLPLTWKDDPGQALDRSRLDPDPCDHVFTALSHEGLAVRLDERPRVRSPH